MSAPDRAPGAVTRWPPGRPRVLATDAWLANAGDAAIALGLQRIVDDLAPGASVLHAAYQHDIVGPGLDELQTVPPLEHLLGTPWAPPAPGWEDAGARLVAEADLVISQGGGFLVERYHPEARIVALDTVVGMGVPLVLLGQTIGRFDRSATRRVLRRVLVAARLVVVRDAASLATVADLGRPDAVLGTDLALALFPEPPHPRRRRGTSVVLTDHDPDPDARPRRRALAAEVLAAVLAELAPLHPGEPVVLWSSVQGLPEAAMEDDAEVAAGALSAVLATDPAADAVEVVTGPLTPGQVVERISSSRALVTMRMHPALFAGATGTPFRLLMDGQRTGVLTGTDLVRCVAPASAAGARRAVAELAAELAVDRGGPPAPTAGWDAFVPLCDRGAHALDLLAPLLVPRCAGPPGSG